MWVLQNISRPVDELRYASYIDAVGHKKVDKKTSIAGSIIEIESPLASSTCGCGESVTFDV